MGIRGDRTQEQICFYGNKHVFCFLNVASYTLITVMLARVERRISISRDRSLRLSLDNIPVTCLIEQRIYVSRHHSKHHSLEVSSPVLTRYYPLRLLHDNPSLSTRISNLLVRTSQDVCGQRRYLHRINVYAPPTAVQQQGAPAVAREATL